MIHTAHWRWEGDLSHPTAKQRKANRSSGLGAIPMGQHRNPGGQRNRPGTLGWLAVERGGFRQKRPPRERILAHTGSRGRQLWAMSWSRAPRAGRAHHLNRVPAGSLEHRDHRADPVPAAHCQLGHELGRKARALTGLGHSFRATGQMHQLPLLAQQSHLSNRGFGVTACPPEVRRPPNGLQRISGSTQPPVCPGRGHPESCCSRAQRFYAPMRFMS